MIITAKYTSTCPRCNERINSGDSVEWERGSKARHVTCLTARSKRAASAPLIACAPGGIQHPAGTNRRAAACDTCGEWLAAGKGRLVRCIEDSGCMQHHDESGWHVYCLDATACKARREQLRAEARARQAEAQVRADAKIVEAKIAEAKRTELTAGLTRVDISGWGSVPSTWQRGEAVATDRTASYAWTLYAVTTPSGPACIEDASGIDDCRTIVYAPQAEIDTICAAALARQPITREQAEEHLAQYRGCVGAELYAYALRAGE